MKAALLSGCQRKKDNPARAIRIASVCDHQRFSIGCPLGVSFFLIAYHISELALGTTQRRNNENTRPIVVTAGEGDLATVGRPVCTANEAALGMGEPEWSFSPDQLHIKVSPNWIFAIPNKCDFLSVRRESRVPNTAGKVGKWDSSHASGCRAPGCGPGQAKGGAIL